MEIRMADCPLGAKCEEVKTVEGRQVLFRCPWYAKVRGIDVNTGKEVDDWACAIAWMPALMINAANESRKGVAATESLRNIVMGKQQEIEKQREREAIKALRMADEGRLTEKGEICG
jgi:hypothetical protein